MAYSKILLATNNPGKVREYRALLAPLPCGFTTPAEEGIDIHVEETGSSYEENARLKALAYAKAGGLLTLADDSGLEVDALGGEPGPRSARYAGEGASDQDNIMALLEKVKDLPEDKRDARFHCIIALALPTGQVEYCPGECQGRIVLEPRGEEGFGYDPIFYLPLMEKTMAELTFDEKNAISHRAMAAEKVRAFLERIFC